MAHINDFANPFDAILEFEQAIADYTGAPYCISTDCCTHAIELCLRYDNIKECAFTPYTYLSIPMTMHKLGIGYSYFPDSLQHRQYWTGEYKFEATRIWDSARRLEPNMYVPGSFKCLSFGRTKPLQIGRGGCILTDDVQAYQALSQMRSDGRDMFAYKNWAEQKTFRVGYHYTMKPEECITGLNLLAKKTFTEQVPAYYNYPDCRKLIIE